MWHLDLYPLFLVWFVIFKLRMISSKNGCKIFCCEGRVCTQVEYVVLKCKNINYVDLLREAILQMLNEGMKLLYSS